MTATTDRCPGCGECPEPERPESVAPRHPGATQSPDGSQGAPEGPRGAEGATGHGISAVPHLETAPLPSASDVRPVPPARDAELVEFEAVSAARYEAGLSAEGRAARHAALAWGAEFRTKPNPDQPDRCPSIDPHDTLQCTRRIHEDGQCQSGGIAWVKGTPRYMSDAERANRMEGMAERLAALLVDVEERLTGERDRARGTAAALEAENARLREGIERLCSDIDNPLRERHDESPHDLPEVAEDLRALLADTDSAQAEGGE